MRTEQFCKDFFREYWNEFLTPKCIASHYGMPVELAKQLIKHGRFLHDLEAEKTKRELEQ
jgi:hypothetical protein